jgi:hypothetical protein
MDDSKLFGNINFMIINYSKIDTSDSDFFDSIQTFLGNGITKRKGSILPNFEASESQKLPDEIFHRFKTEVSKYDWDKYEIK